MPDAKIPNTQALSSSTFTPPPLDGSLTIPEIYDFHFSRNANHPLFLYDLDEVVQTVNWKKAVAAVYEAACLVQSCVRAADQRRPVVAILAVIDQLSYFALSAGIMRAGYVPFPISPRNSDLGVANLLQKMDVKHIFVSKDQAMQNLAASACKHLSPENEGSIEILSIPPFSSLYKNATEIYALPAMEKPSLDEVAIILHSSGSTSFPKPIVLKHRNLLQWGLQPYYGEIDICGRVLSNHSLPFFHAMGVVSLQWATLTGITLSNFAPRDPPVVSNPDRVYSSAVATGSSLIFCVPSFLEEWYQDPIRLSTLQKFEAVLFGGAPIQKAVGDILSAAGVRLYPFYGATEVGGTSKFLPQLPPKEGWEYFQISNHCLPEFTPQSDQDTYQISFLSCESHKPAVSNININGIDGYDTNDILIRHPTNPQLWKIYGRADDQIMHSTGEKTNPVPIETIINRHPMVSSAVMFGRARFQAGVLVEPTSAYVSDPEDLSSLASFRNQIWPIIEEANNFAPSHSRIFKEMILVAKPSKPFQFTPKGTPRRQIILNLYDMEIEEAYAAVEASAQTDVPVPDVFDLDRSLEFVRRVVAKVFTVPLADDDDFFQHGCDSLQATWIRNSILHALRQSSEKISTDKIPINFVYLNPSVSSLGRYMSRLASQELSGDAAGETMTLMGQLVRKYSSDFPCHKPATSTYPTAETILLTGSTGGLGSYVLESLLREPTVSRVYAMNRRDKKGRSPRLRQTTAFQERGIDVALLNSIKLVFVEGDTSLEGLGLGPEVLEEVSTRVTCIIHAAWRVDFNVALSSMEPLVAGTRRLIDLSLSSPLPKPPRIVFASSIGVVRNWSDGFVPEAPICDPAVAVGSGYPESKWVSERILTLAAQETPLYPVIVRIGQLSGGRNGCWNPHEWVPSIIKSGEILRCLPQAPGVISWIPVHIAASALVEMRNSKSQFLHLVHPTPIPWNQLMSSVAQALKVPLVPYSQWLGTLEANTTPGTPNNVDPAVDNPALRLLDFFQSANKPLLSNDAEAFGFPRLTTQAAAATAPSLQNGQLTSLGVSDVDGWLQYWLKLGFISHSSLVSKSELDVSLHPPRPVFGTQHWSIDMSGSTDITIPTERSKESAFSITQLRPIRQYRSEGLFSILRSLWHTLQATYRNLYNFTWNRNRFFVNV